MNIPQEVINWLLLGISGVIGWGVNAIRNALKELQDTDSKLADRVHDIALLVAGLQQFQSDTTAFRAEVLASLRALHVKIDGKMDKEEMR